MKKLVILYIDGLKPEYLNFMPKLASYAARHFFSPMKTVLGYSTTVHASITTGYYPENNGVFLSYYHKAFKSNSAHDFYWTHSFDFFPLFIQPYSKLLVSKYLTLRKKSYGFRAGMIQPVLDKICYEEIEGLPSIIDIVTKPTLFDLLKEKVNVKFYHDQFNTEYFWKESVLSAPLTLYYTTIFDTAAQKYGIDNEKFRKIARSMDAKIISFLEMHKEKNILIISDHGMVRTRKVIVIEQELKKAGLINGKDFIAVFDPTFARFWITDNNIIQKIKKFFSSHPDFEFLDQKKQKMYHVNFKNNKYGDLMFLCNPGVVLTLNPLQKKFRHGIKAMHGYSPDEKEMDAIFISNFIKPKNPKVVDIVPTIIDYFHLSTSPMDGTSLIKKKKTKTKKIEQT